MSYLPPPTPYGLKIAGGLILALYEVALLSARHHEAGARKGSARRPQKGLTLHPRQATPIWNELVVQARPWLRQRGQQAHLGRLLGVPRQRIHACLIARKACLDTERALLLLCWITARRQGRDLLA
jgi:hypothetical protein